MAVIAADFLCQSSDRLPVSFNPISSPRAHHRSPQTPPCHDHHHNMAWYQQLITIDSIERHIAVRGFIKK